MLKELMNVKNKPKKTNYIKSRRNSRFFFVILKIFYIFVEEIQINIMSTNYYRIPKHEEMVIRKEKLIKDVELLDLIKILIINGIVNHHGVHL